MDTFYQSLSVCLSDIIFSKSGRGGSRSSIEYMLDPAIECYKLIQKTLGQSVLISIFKLVVE